MEGKINNVGALAEMLKYRNDMEIHDYYIVQLIQDMVYEIDQENEKINKEICDKSVEILTSYIDDCKNDECMMRGLVITNHIDHTKRKELYINEVEELVTTIKGIKEE